MGFKDQDSLLRKLTYMLVLKKKNRLKYSPVLYTASAILLILNRYSGKWFPYSSYRLILILQAITIFLSTP